MAGVVSKRRGWVARRWRQQAFNPKEADTTEVCVRQVRTAGLGKGFGDSRLWIVQRPDVLVGAIPYLEALIWVAGHVGDKRYSP